MKLGFISDTHDHVEHCKLAVALFKKHSVDRVLHAGDFCSPFMVPLFEGLNLTSVFGNNDGDRYLLMKKHEKIGASLEGEFYEFEIDQKRYVLYHGTVQSIKDALIRSQKYDFVISGHTHKVEDSVIGKTRSINPGTAHGFGEKATVAIFDTISNYLQFIEISRI